MSLFWSSVLLERMLHLYLWPIPHSTSQCILASFGGSDDPFSFPNTTISLCISSSGLPSPASPTSELLDSLSHLSHLIPAVGETPSAAQGSCSPGLCPAKGLKLASSSLSKTHTGQRAYRAPLLTTTTWAESPRKLHSDANLRPQRLLHSCQRARAKQNKNRRKTLNESRSINIYLEGSELYELLIYRP